MGTTIGYFALNAALTAMIIALGYKAVDNAKANNFIGQMTSAFIERFKDTRMLAFSAGAWLLQMAVSAGKTYAPQWVASWVKDYVTNNGVYEIAGNSVSFNARNHVSEMKSFSNVPTAFSQLTVTVGLADGTVFPAGGCYILARAGNSAVVIMSNRSSGESIWSSDSHDVFNIRGILFSDDHEYSDEFPIYPMYGEQSRWCKTCVGVFVSPIGSLFRADKAFGKSFKVSLPYYNREHEAIYYGGWSFKDFSAEQEETLEVGASSISTYDVQTSGSDNVTGWAIGEGGNAISEGVDIPINSRPTETEGIGDDVLDWLRAHPEILWPDAGVNVGGQVVDGSGVISLPIDVPISADSAITGSIAGGATASTNTRTEATDSTITNEAINVAPSVDPSRPPINNISASQLYTIWNPTQGELNSLGSFMWSTGFVETIIKVLQNPMEACISLSVIPFNPPVSGRSNIKLGYVDSGVASNKVSNQFVQFQTSGLLIPYKYSSFLDYEPYTSVEVFLPYIGHQRLNTCDVMGKTVSLYYNIDILSGDLACIVSVNGVNMYQFGGNCAMFLPLTAGNFANTYGKAITSIASLGGAISTGNPFMMAGAVGGILSNPANAVMRGGSASGNSGFLGDYQPYVIITRPIPDIPTSYGEEIGFVSNKTAQIGSLSGYTKFTEVHLDTVKCTSGERTEIESILKGGVYL